MPDYDINQLGSRPFEQMIVAICMNVVGAGLEPFGDGPDGGREATFDGEIDWSKTVAGADGRWNGFTVFQAKFHYNQTSVSENLVWFKNQIQSELERWATAVQDGKRERAPKYIVFASNVRLSSNGVSGGIDQINTWLRNKLANEDDAAHEMGIEDFRIWHNATINTFLDNATNVRRAFPALLTIGDVLESIGSNTSPGSAAGVGDVLKLHAAQSLRNERWVRFSESGATGGEKAKLEEVGRDLPGSYSHNDSDTRTVQAVSAIIAHGDAVLRCQMEDRVAKPHWVIIGGPGQGKTTLSALVAQIYRSAILHEGHTSPEVKQVATATLTAMAEIGIEKPRNLRWPMRIDLTRLADELMSVPDMSILNFLARSIANRVTSSIDSGQLQSWLRIWPWVLILDGLDEVSDVGTRRLLLERVTDFLEVADQINADLLIIATTRPLGYDERFDRDKFTEIRLNKLTPSESQHFGSKLVRLRLADDPDQMNLVLKRLRAAAREPATRRLMETPLQVTIMSYIVETSGRLPPSRYELFSMYYATVYQREVNKPGASSLAQILTEHKTDVQNLHSQVALEIHAESETRWGAREDVMPIDRLEEILRVNLHAQGYNNREVDSVSSALVDAAMYRLVLLVPVDNAVRFEIRSMQEFMAATALTTGSDARVLSNLRVILRHPHWRNVWLLAAGRIHTSRTHQQDEVLAAVRRCDTALSGTDAMLPVSWSLAEDVLEDGFANRAPRLRRAYLEIAMQRLEHYPNTYRATSLADFLASSADLEDVEYVFTCIRNALKAGGARQKNGLLMLRELRRSKALLNKVELEQRVAAVPQSVQYEVASWNRYDHGDGVPDGQEGDGPGRVTIQSMLLDELDELEWFGLDAIEQPILREALTCFNEFHIVRSDMFESEVITVYTPTRVKITPLQGALDNDNVDAALALLLEHIEIWSVRSALERALRVLVDRRPVGHLLLGARGEQPGGSGPD